MSLLYALIVLFAAAWAEVLGDWLIYRGMTEKSRWLIPWGSALLVLYGLGVNSYNAWLRSKGKESWDFAHLIGVYVVFFALVAVAWGAIDEKKLPSPLTMAGVVVVALGGWLIHLGKQAT